MYKTKTTFTISAAHRLELDYDSPCNRFHGHNWVITVYCKCRCLDRNGMLIDFARIKKLVKGTLDHRTVNDFVDGNPTAENMAFAICNLVNKYLTTEPICYRVDVQETEGNVATYEKDIC